MKHLFTLLISAITLAGLYSCGEWTTYETWAVASKMQIERYEIDGKVWLDSVYLVRKESNQPWVACNGGITYFNYEVGYEYEVVVRIDHRRDIYNGGKMREDQSLFLDKIISKTLIESLDVPTDTIVIRSYYR